MLIRARYRLYFTLTALQFYRVGAKTRTAVRLALTLARTAGAALILFRRPASGLIAYLKEAGILLAPHHAGGTQAQPSQRSRIPSSGLLQSGYAALRNIFAAGGREEQQLLEDCRVVRLQAVYIRVHFPRIFGIVPAAEDIEVLARFAGVDRLYRSLAAAAGIAVGSRSVLGTEARYRARVAYPTFLRLLSLRLSRRRLEGERRDGGPAAVAGGRERFAGLYPHRLTVARLEAVRRNAGGQIHARRLSDAAGEELLLLRLHFAAYSLLTTSQLRRQYDSQAVFHKLETIHSYRRRIPV